MPYWSKIPKTEEIGVTFWHNSPKHLTLQTENKRPPQIIATNLIGRETLQNLLRKDYEERA